jgi:aminopeptidase
MKVICGTGNHVSRRCSKNPKFARGNSSMLDTLFDEKIGGSFHLTPGQAYEIADNGNKSRIHWDLVLIQRPDYGGEICFDGELVRKHGRFVPADLAGLNEGL